ncbi:hypothetical protein CHF27_011265 [Romboutsia maritimum]|uniref:Uncharacterized protein n=1 Tax=Romboutsia maritimum TaxID=2020948 RepID=A0A371IQY6_9FIRM|nr:hypothetical protein [Romboutsia maritimum]RDY22891.1 hypothetical protein CHF27_011265 [Romboutsia maritimum]
MKIVLRQNIMLKEVHKTIRIEKIEKTLNSDVIPREGTIIIDEFYETSTNFDGLYRAKDIAIDYKENTCYVDLQDIVIQSYEEIDLDKEIERAEALGWIYLM